MDKIKNFQKLTSAKHKEELAVYSMAFCYSVVIKEIDDYLKSCGLSTAKFNTLMVIKHQSDDNGISQVEIGKRLIVTASNMTKLLDRLNNEGLILRHAQENDRRVNLIKITGKGSKMLDNAWDGYVAKIKELTSHLEKEQVNQLTSIMVDWFEKLKK